MINVLHPIAWSDDEMRFAIAAPAGLGALVGLGRGRHRQPRNQQIVVSGIAVTPLHVAAPADPRRDRRVRRVHRRRPGRLRAARGPARADRPGRAAAAARAAAARGVAAAGCAARRAARLDGPVPARRSRSGSTSSRTSRGRCIDGHQLIAGRGRPATTGQTLVDLTRQMYDYHNNLIAGHAASSPWWAWPFDLKPVWFYQEGLAGGTTAAIYDAGNLVDLVARDPGDGVRGVAGVRAPEPGARADRHRVRLPVALVGADRPGRVPVPLLHERPVHRPGPRLLRGGAVARRVAPDVALRPGRGGRRDPRAGDPLAVRRGRCARFVGVERAVPGSAACPPVIPNLVVTAQTAALALVAFLAIVAFIYLLATLNPARDDLRSALLKLAGIAVGGGRRHRRRPWSSCRRSRSSTSPGFPAEPLVLILAPAAARAGDLRRDGARCAADSSWAS